jgi:hypothetical protein
MRRAIPAAVVLAAALLFAPSARLAGVTVVVTSDTEGHVNPCAACPHGAGDGGLARRATAVGTLRGAGAVLLVDAGNALFGPDSLDSGGAVIVDAYNQLRYDAVNLSFRDFRLGKDATLNLLKRATFAAVSANVLDAATGRPLVRPYAVREAGGKRVAVVGLSESPAGMEYLPHLKRQLAGVRIVAPHEALAETLPKARAEADVVVVLYYGAATGAKKLADAFGKDVAAVLLGGVRPEELPRATGIPLVAAEQHGKSLARLTLPAAPGEIVGAPEVVAITDSLAADPAMEALLAKAAPARANPAEPATAADAKPKGGSAEAEAPGVRPLIQVDVKPLEPEPAQQSAERVQSETASAERPAPEVVAEPHPESKPAGGSGVLGFLKSLVSGHKGGAGQRPAAEAQADVSAGTAGGVAPPGASAVAPPARTTTPKSRTAAPAATGPKFCTHCGARLVPNAKFCTACGTRVRR